MKQNTKSQPNQQTKQHLKLIEQLLAQNNLLKQKYQKILRQHQRLKYKYKNLSQHCPQQIVSQVDIQYQFDNKNISDVKNSKKNIGDLGHRQSRTQSQLINEATIQLQLQNENIVGNNTSKIAQNEGPNQKLTKKQSSQSQLNSKKLERFRSSRSSSRSSMNELFFPIIEGCFILQKKKCLSQQKGQKNSLSEMLQFVYPAQLMKTQRQALEMMVKYTLTNPQIQRVQDDEFNSRRNEVIYGTPYQDYMYAFQDAKWIGRRQLPEILKLMGTMKKKYYHILVKPQIVPDEQIQGPVQKQKQVKKKQSQQNSFKEQVIQQPIVNQKQSQLQSFYQTEVIFGFISPFPLRIFFQDLHRTIQQQLKYSQFVSDTSQLKVFSPEQNRKNKYKILGKIMQKLFDQQYRINRFPINFTYNTGITSIHLNIPTVIAYREMEDEYLNQALQKYSSSKVCKLLHYILAQKCILLGSTDKRSLNQLFQIIRILIRPFLWIFAVVYVYSDYFQPFMSSPMPIIIGKLQQEQFQEDKNKKQKQKKELQRQKSLEYSQFCHILMDNQEIEVKQSEPFSKSIKKLKKQLEKLQKKDSKQKKQEKSALIHNYVHNLRVFIQKGIINNQPTDFHIEFIDTQMVSYFKEPSVDV